MRRKRSLFRCRNRKFDRSPDEFFLFAPDEPGGGGSTQSVQSTAEVPDFSEGDVGLPSRGTEGTSVSAADPVARTASAPSQQDATPQPAQARPTPQQSTAQQASEWVSIVAAMRAEGLDPGSDDDRAAFSNLISMARQGQAATLNQRRSAQLMPGQGQYPQYPSQYQQPGFPPQQQQVQSVDPWERPQFDKRWASMVKQDPSTGLYVGEPGTDPAIVVAANKYATWLDKFSTEPEGFVDYRFQKLFAAEFEKRFGDARQAQESQAAAQQILSQHADWIYARDQTSQQVLYGLNGQPSLSPSGQRYVQLIREAEQMGVRDPRHQDRIAINALRSEIYDAQAQQAQAQSGQQRPQTQQAQYRPNTGPAHQQNILDRANNPAAREPSMAGLSLRDAMARELQGANITDDDINFSD